MNSSQQLDTISAPTSINKSAPPKRNRRKFTVKRALLYCALGMGAFLAIFPFYWMLVLASHSLEAIYQFPPKVLPGDQLKQNFENLFATVNLFAPLMNTIIVSVSVTALVLFLSSLAAFSFAKFQYPGKKGFFSVLMVTYMLPGELATIPMFLLMVHLGWVSSLKALIIPSAVSAFGIFWLKQYMETSIPDSLLDAARIDGCGFFGQYLHVAVPCSRPALGFLGMFTFVGSWNSFMWPLIVLNDPDKLTLQVALAQLNVVHGQDYAMTMAGALFAVTPLIVVFVIGSRNFVKNITAGAVKE